jgi:hypothetical protein
MVVGAAATVPVLITIVVLTRAPAPQRPATLPISRRERFQLNASSSLRNLRGLFSEEAPIIGIG